MPTNVGDAYVTDEMYLAVTRAGRANPVQDVFLPEDLEAASRVIDSKLERVFTLTDIQSLVAGNEAFRHIALPDLAQVTQVSHGQSRIGPFETIPAANYTLRRDPLFPTGPYTSIEFDDVFEWIRINGRWGWSETPSPIKRATILIAQRARLELPSAEYTEDRFRNQQNRTLDIVDTIINTYCETYRKRPSASPELDWFVQ